jgi:heme-degrading monooxygenase HmoA
MLAMQYRFDLPPAIDPDTVRTRARDVGPSFEGLPGLHMKAFLVASAPATYAPIYVWDNDASMRAFLASEAFTRVVAKYGKPTFSVFAPIRIARSATPGAPRFATQERSALPVPAVFDGNGGTVRADANVLVGADLSRWESVRTTFWQDPPPFREGQVVYDIPYLIGALP